MTDVPKRPRRRRVRRREWVALGAALAVVLVLGAALLLRPPGSPDQAAGSDADRPTITVTVTDAAPSTDQSKRAPAGPPHADDDASSPGVVSSVAQPPVGPDAPDSTARTASPIGPLGDHARRTPGDPLARGEVDAPVVMVMFSDYRCPFCAKFSRDLEPLIVEKYVETGRLRIEWRDFPIFGDQSVRAAVAGRAAAAQGKFWEFNRAVYAAAPQTGHPDLTDHDLLAFAKQAGVPDMTAFRAGLDDPDLRAAVMADFDAGSTLGVPATPSFLVNGYPLRGAQPIDEFSRLIDTVESLQ